MVCYRGWAGEDGGWEAAGGLNHPLGLFGLAIVQQGMNHDKPYFSNMSGINMLIFMTNYYTFL